MAASSLITLGQSTQVKIETTKGTITVMLYDDTPLHRDNFVKLAKSGFYDELLFHRVIKNFMIQAGDPDSKGAPAGKMLGTGGPGYTIPAEIKPNHFHKKGVLSAARLSDAVNPKRESSGSQFYIVQGNKFTDMQLDGMEKQMGTKFSKEQRDVYVEIGGTPHLDNQYTVFGEVIDGLKIVDNIAAVATARGDRPLEDVKIIKMTVITK
ncbi:peptidylprolyl isomerase [Bacteroidales bacterium OttesenSCG-928-I21]|nr:peptidylprolyl isomerase [Bacteroidales bacterium OttesenSCG-928-I21]